MCEQETDDLEQKMIDLAGKIHQKVDRRTDVLALADLVLKNMDKFDTDKTDLKQLAEVIQQDEPTDRRVDANALSDLVLKNLGMPPQHSYSDGHYKVEKEKDKLKIIHKIEGDPAYKIILTPRPLEGTTMNILVYGDFATVLQKLNNTVHDYKERHEEGKPTGETELTIDF